MGWRRFASAAGDSEEIEGADPFRVFGQNRIMTPGSTSFPGFF